MKPWELLSIEYLVILFNLNVFPQSSGHQKSNIKRLDRPHWSKLRRDGLQDSDRPRRASKRTVCFFHDIAHDWPKRHLRLVSYFSGNSLSKLEDFEKQGSKNGSIYNFEIRSERCWSEVWLPSLEAKSQANLVRQPHQERVLKTADLGPVESHSCVC
jgi:hypothetical protein